MSRLLISSLVTIALFSAGCATTEIKESAAKENPGVQTTAAAPVPARPQPDWVTGESRDYPRLDYIAIRTQASSADAAAQEALGKLSRMFMVDLNQYDLSERQALESAGYEINRANQPAEAMTIAAPEIQRILDKIKVVDQWHDDKNNTDYALAVLPRNTGLGYLRSQIQMLDTNTDDYMKNADEATDPLTKMGMVALAWRSQQLRESLQESMVNTDLTRHGIRPKWELKKLDKDINELLVNLNIYPSGVAGDTNEAAITDALNSALKITDITPAKKEKADYLLSATVESSIIGEENGWAVGQGKVHLTISDKANKERNHKDWTLKVPGINEDGALRRVLEKSEYTLKKEMRNSLIDMALGN